MTVQAPDLTKLNPGEEVNLGAAGRYTRLPSGGYAPASSNDGQYNSGDSRYSPPASPSPAAPPAGGAPPTSPSVPSPTNIVPGGSTAGDVSTARSNTGTIQTQDQIEADARSQALSNAQGRISSLNDVYDKQLASELSAQGDINKQNLGRTNALSALMGLSGSSTADTRTADTSDKGNKANAAITDKVNAKRMADLNGIYNSIDANAQKMSDANIATNNANQKQLLDDVSSNATTYFQSIAKSLGSVTFDQFKTADSKQYQELQKQTGLSDYQLQALWNKSMPTPPATTESVGTDESGNAVLYQSTFGANGQATTQKFDTGVPFAEYNGGKGVVKGANGELLVPDPKNPGSYKRINPVSEAEKLKNDLTRSQIDKNNKYQPPNPAGSKTASKDDISKISGVMQKVTGSDGYISPKDWQGALNEWTNAGYSAASFISNFKNFANPKDTYAGLAGNKKANDPASSSPAPIPGLTP